MCSLDYLTTNTRTTHLNTQRTKSQPETELFTATCQMQKSDNFKFLSLSRVLCLFEQDIFTKNIVCITRST